MQPMSIRGPSTSMETPINWISDYTVVTDSVTSHSRTVLVPIGRVHSCRKSFRKRLKVCLFGCLRSASIYRIRKHTTPTASLDHYYPIAIYQVFRQSKRWTNFTLKSSTTPTGMTSHTSRCTTWLWVRSWHSRHHFLHLRFRPFTARRIRH